MKSLDDLVDHLKKVDVVITDLDGCLIDNKLIDFFVKESIKHPKDHLKFVFESLSDLFSYNFDYLYERDYKNKKNNEKIDIKRYDFMRYDPKKVKKKFSLTEYLWKNYSSKYFNEDEFREYFNKKTYENIDDEGVELLELMKKNNEDSLYILLTRNNKSVVDVASDSFKTLKFDYVYFDAYDKYSAVKNICYELYYTELKDESKNPRKYYLSIGDDSSDLEVIDALRELKEEGIIKDYASIIKSKKKKYSSYADYASENFYELKNKLSISILIDYLNQNKEYYDIFKKRESKNENK